MPETIEIEVGGLYSRLHEQFAKELGDQYTEELRQSVEDYIHNKNQMYERQMEASRQADSEEVEESDN